MENIYCKNILSEKVDIQPNDFNLSNGTDILDIITKKLKRKTEGKCIKQGYVKKNSLQIINRSMGQIYDGHFTGDIIYQVKFCVEVCNPPEGQNINCTVYNNNKMGVVAGIGENMKDSPLMILLPRHHHQDNEIFRDIEIGDDINIEIIGKKFELNDNKIHVIASLINKNTKQDKVIKIKKKKKGGYNNLDISHKQFIHQRQEIINKNIRTKGIYDGEFVGVVNHLKKNISIEKWDIMDITQKNELIDSSIKYISTEKKMKTSYGDKWDMLTNIDRKNIINKYLDENESTLSEDSSF